MSPKHKSVLYPLLAALFGALASLFASGCLQPAQAARVEKFECQVRALKPYVEGVYNERELVRDLLSGKADIRVLVANLGLVQREVDALQEELNACEPPLPVVKGEPS